MEDKHIYAPTFRKRFQDKYQEIKSSIFQDYKDIYKDLSKPFRKSVEQKGDFLSQKTTKSKEIGKKVVASKAPEVPVHKVSTPKAKRVFKLPEISRETGNKILTYILIVSIITVMAIGIYLTYRPTR